MFKNEKIFKIMTFLILKKCPYYMLQKNIPIYAIIIHYDVNGGPFCHFDYPIQVIKL